MSLGLTTKMLEAAYEFLRTTYPFNYYSLPGSGSVIFNIVQDRSLIGGYQKNGKNHVIIISDARVGHTITLIETMAHEMLHLTQNIDKSATKGNYHNNQFRQLARAVCKEHGFDPKEFC